MFKKFRHIAFGLLILIWSCDNEPYEGPLNIDVQISCETAIDNLTEAETNYGNVNADNYTSYCVAYKEALESYINTCADDSNEIVELLNDLGDCELSSFFQVDFDSQTFFADESEAFLEQDKIIIKGLRGDNGEMIELILNHTNEGTYPLGITANNGQVNIGQYSPDSSHINAWQSVNDANVQQGQITITEIDYFNASISGTFNFTAYDEANNTKNFTNGIFEKIKLTKDNNFFAKVDGEEFIDIQIVPGINNFGWIGFLAKNAQNAEIYIGVNHDITPGTYNFSQEPLGIRIFDYSPSFQDFHYGNGTVTITVHNPETNFLMGTFSCTAVSENDGTSTYEITEGRFCVTYLDGFFED